MAQQRSAIRFILILLVSLLIKCSTREPETIKDPVVDFAGESQRFTFHTKQQFIINGRQGTIIRIDPKNLETIDGGPIGNDITVELKELVDQPDLAKANAQTISNGKLLISGGAYFLNISSEGKDVRIKNGRNITVEFPKLSNQEMILFYGQKDSLGQMNWLETDTKLSQNSESKNIASDIVSEFVLEGNDTIYSTSYQLPGETEERKAERSFENALYQAINISQLGWINVDRFYKMTKTKDLQFSFHARDSVKNAIVFMIFEDYNSVLIKHYFDVNGIILNNVFGPIPVDGKVKLIAVTKKNSGIYTARKTFNLESNSNIEFKLKRTSEEKLADLFD